jgi:hypothetical protein
MPIAQIIWRLRQEDHLSPGVADQSRQHSETLSQKKKEKKWLLGSI